MLVTQGMLSLECIILYMTSRGRRFTSAWCLADLITTVLLDKVRAALKGDGDALKSNLTPTVHMRQLL